MTSYKKTRNQYAGDLLRDQSTYDLSKDFQLYDGGDGDESFVSFTTRKLNRLYPSRGDKTLPDNTSDKDYWLSVIIPGAAGIVIAFVVGVTGCVLCGARLCCKCPCIGDKEGVPGSHAAFRVSTVSLYSFVA